MMIDTRNNPAQSNRWNAWRFPTEAEIARGRREDDPFWVGASLDRGEAERMLREHGGGQVQWGCDGEVFAI